MEQTEPAQSARGDLHVGHLERHANDESKVGEIEIVRWSLAGKIETASMSILPRLVAVAVKDVRVMQSKDGVDEHP